MISVDENTPRPTRVAGFVFLAVFAAAIVALLLAGFAGRPTPLLARTPADTSVLTVGDEEYLKLLSSGRSQLSDLNQRRSLIVLQI